MPTIVIDNDVRVPMRDGTSLAATVFRPSGRGPYPAVLMRTPYDRSSAASVTLQVNAPELAAAGYAVVVQDVRGRFESGGEFEPFVSEQEDGIDSIDWLAGQVCCDGSIGMAGLSYNAFTQIAVASAGLENLKAWVPGLTPGDVRWTWVRQGGVLDLGFHLAWALGAIVGSDWRTDDPHSLLAAFDDPARIVRRGPSDQPELTNTRAGSWFRSWVDSADPYPNDKRVPPIDNLGHVRSPALVIGGWFDVFCQGSIQLGTALRRTNPDLHAVIMGPWDHSGLPFRRRSGDGDFGRDAVLDLHSLQKGWFDRHLRLLDSKEPQSAVFITGLNRWVDTSDLPTPIPRMLRLTSRMGIEQDGVDGDHAVTLDPGDPTPTLGGRLFPWEPFLRCGSFDQRGRRNRHDVLAFTSRPLDDKLLVVGPVTSRIQLQANVAAPTVVVTLVEIGADGTAFNIADGLGIGHATAGEVGEIDVIVGDVAHEFSPRSRIGLDIAFGSFPRLAPELGTRTVGRATLTLPEIAP